MATGQRAPLDRDRSGGVAEGRRCHVYAVYTRKRDVTRRLENNPGKEGIRVAVLTSDVPTEKREAWFETKLQQGIEVTICHPKIIETGSICSATPP